VTAHWFERYRQAYQKWWEATAAELDDEEREDFDSYKSPDSLTPMRPAMLQEAVAAFPALQTEIRDFLTRFGVGDFRFPDHYGDHQPPTYRVFDRDEVDARITAIREHAERELEELADAIECEIHGDATDQCAALLTTVRDKPQRFYPFFGRDDAHDFIYVLQGEPKAGVVARWYHDYPVCELLDGSNDTADLDVYGEKLIAMVKSDDENPL